MTEQRGSHGIELRHLRAFIVVAEERSFTRAAQRLLLTQPSLSRAVVALEQALGTRLLSRDRHSVALTAAGARFLAHAHRVLAVFDEAVDSARQTTSTLRIGFTSGATAEITSPVVRAFEAEHTEVKVELRRYDDAGASLSEGKCHLAFMVGGAGNPAWATLLLCEEPRIAALPAQHPLTNREVLTLDDLREHPVVVNVLAGTTHPDLWRPGLRPRRFVRVQNIEEWLEAIATGRGLGLTPAATGRVYRHPQIAYRAVSDAPPVPISLAWKTVGGHPLIADFVAVAARSAQDHPPDELVAHGSCDGAARLDHPPWANLPGPSTATAVAACCERLMVVGR
jgi:DNA-binding transcriptional LysR family regulator